MPIVPPMFPTSASPEYSSILVGRRPQRMVSALEHIFDLSLQNPLITYLTGTTGSGKSHTILHMQYRARVSHSRFMVVINANQYDIHDKEGLGQRRILEALHGDRDIRQRAKLAGCELSPSSSSLTMERQAEEINQAVGAIGQMERASRGGRGKPYGLVVAIDGLDELFRPIMQTGGFQSYAEQLVLNVRFLLDALVRTCIVLSFTTDVFEEIRKVVPQDRTFLRRFIPPQEFNGTGLDFREFNMEEARQLYGRFRDAWFDRARGFGFVVGAVAGQPHWPISWDAVELARAATTARPGPLQGIFQSAFEALQRRHPGDWLSPSTFVDLRLMAEVIEVAAKRAEHGVDLSRKEVQRQMKLLGDWERLASKSARGPSPARLADVFGAWLEAAEFTLTKRSATQIPSGTLYMLPVTKGRQTGNVGLLCLLNHGPGEDDLVVLNKLVAMSAVHQVIVVTKQDHFDWIYSPWDRPIQYDGAGQRDLGNYTYVLRLGPEQLSGIGVAGDKLNTPDQSAALWVADRLCSPIKGYRFSEILSGVARNAIGIANL